MVTLTNEIGFGNALELTPTRAWGCPRKVIFLFVQLRLTIWRTYFMPLVSFHTPENIRKPEVFFWCFQGVSTSGNITWNIYNGAFCKNNYMIKAIILVKSAIIDICRVHYSCSWTWIIYSPCVWRAIISKFRHLHLFLLLVTFIHKTDRILFWKKYTYLV